MERVFKWNKKGKAGHRNGNGFALVSVLFAP
jgi:hypothetical protein